MKITPLQRIQLIEAISTEANAGEDVLMDVARGRKRTKTEIELAELIATIYRIIHPLGTCKNPHSDWEKENEKLIKQYQLL